jgi:hypothetical protein
VCKGGVVSRPGSIAKISTLAFTGCETLLDIVPGHIPQHVTILVAGTGLDRPARSISLLQAGVDLLLSCCINCGLLLLLQTG